VNQLAGSVSGVVYHNPDTGYTVLRLRANGTPQNHTVVGQLPKLSEGEWLCLEGQWINHPKFGEQFQVSGYRVQAPQGPEEIERYLAGGLFTGIGPSTAKKIVGYLGEATFSILDTRPEKLLSIPKLSKKVAQELIRQWQEQKETRELMVFLQSYHLPASLATKLNTKYGPRALEIIKSQPYQLSTDVGGIGFSRADEIALALGFDREDPQRLFAGIRYALQKHCEAGHVYALRETLVNKSAELLACTQDLLNYHLDNNSDSSLIFTDNQKRYYLPVLYVCEKKIARYLIDLTHRNHSLRPFLPSSYEIPQKSPQGFSYTIKQQQAMHSVVEQSLFILTGGPGTGKTTTLWGILRLFLQANLSVSLAAPTGRAAKRLSEVTGFPALTLHRLLKWEPQTRTYMANENNPLQAQVLIIDEVSMIDTYLMYSLLKALPQNCRLVLVGDKDQLPSIGPGNILRDLTHHPQIPKLHLDQVTRQAENSDIILHAHGLLKGKTPQIPLNNLSYSLSKDPGPQLAQNSDFSWIACTSVFECIEALTQCLRALAVGAHNYRHWQVLTPLNQGPLGIHALNIKLQALVNNQAQGIALLDNTWKIKDKVMQIKNNYDKGVFNGDIGEIASINKAEQKITVRFEEIVEYRFEELREIQLAYASTIHKSQGSEFDTVFLVIHPIHSRMLQRNLLYTAFTRAKKKLILIGPPVALQQGVENSRVEERLTTLPEWINEAQATAF